MIEKIFEISRKYPSKAAITVDEHTYSYCELCNAILSLSHFLNQFPKETTIALLFEKGFWIYAAEIASVYSGVVFCPLDIEIPVERNLTILKNLQPDLILTDNKYQDIILNHFKPETIINLGQFSIDEQKFIKSRVGDFAYIIFTSGSTGLPKGIRIKRKSLYKFLDWSINYYPVDKSDKWAQFSSIAFDLSIVDIFTCLMCGAELFCLKSPNDKFFPSRVIHKHAITVWHGVPSTIQLLTEFGKVNSKSLSSLRIATFCGETLWASQVSALWELNKTIKIYNTYGPTEATLFCTAYEVLESDLRDKNNTSISIGDAIPGWNLYVEQGSNMHFGELIIYGNYLGEYILKDKNEGLFFDFYIDELKYRGYQSGDMLKIENGKYYFIGRNDSQIKINGNRFELKEIESLTIDAGATECLAVFKNNSILLAVVLPEKITLTIITNYLEKHLPSFAIPKKIEIFKLIPRNQNGKLDRKKIAELL